ncbi:MAG: hypothetical protein HY300_13860 [Verrucomicrobia bacterium]|nr:hypothetical protein [Verrucomicrobiota bacterium]
MKPILLLFAAAGLLMGCNKSKPSETPPVSVVAPPQTAPVPAGAPAPVAPTADVLVPTESDIGLATLNKAVNAYTMGLLKEPQTLDDLVKAGFIKKIPAPPPGKKFALNANKTAVIMVNQ